MTALDERTNQARRALDAIESTLATLTKMARDIEPSYCTDTDMATLTIVGDLLNEAEDEAKETETVDVNLTTQAKGRKRPQIRVIEGMPTDRRSKEFYRAVVNNVYPFSESGAGNCRVSQRGFRKIRDALMARGLADWKDAARHKSGVDLNDGAFGLMSALSSRR